MRSLVFAVGLCLVSVSALNAETNKQCDINDICADAGSNLELKECYARLLKQEDNRLNSEYQTLIKKIEEQGFSNPKVILSRLRESQKKWINYRDSYCSFRYSTAEGGSIGGLYDLDCKCTLTRDKAAHLSDDIGGLAAN